MAETDNEITNIAYDVGAKINGYSKLLHVTLEKWNSDNQKLHDLLNNSPLNGLLSALQGLQDATKTPPSGKSYNTIPYSESMALYNLLKNQNESLLQSMQITGVKITFTYADGSPNPASPIQGDPGNYTMGAFINDINWVTSQGLKLTGATIDITPAQAQKNLEIITGQLAQDPNVAAAYNQLQGEISQTQTDITKDAFQVMYFFNAMRSNQRALSAALKTLNTIAENGFKSIS